MNTLSKKIIFYYLLAVIIGFSFLGFGMISAFENYFYSENNILMLNQAVEISKTYKYLDENSETNKKDYFHKIYLIDEYSSHEFFITNDNFEVILKSEGTVNLNVNDVIEFEKADDVLSGNTVYSTSKFNDKFDNYVYFVSYPIKGNDNNVIASVFVFTSLRNLYSSISKIYVLFILFAIIASIIGLTIIYLSMSKILANITKINNAAKQVAFGNFNEHIDIKGNDELAQLSASFNDMSQNLARSEEYKNEFLSNIAHDIRSPITSIRGFIDAILDGTVPAERINKYLNIIKLETDRLNKLTDSILNLNKTSSLSNKLMIRDFNINKLVKNTIDSVVSRVYEKNIKVTEDFEYEEIIVSADYEKIQRVLYNLYDNAVKFTNVGGVVTNKISIKDNKAYISVINSGDGLTEEECKKVFDRLYKTDASRGVDKIGLGLGLSIVKDFINMHGETITVKSVPKEYTTFTFTLPVKLYK